MSRIVYIAGAFGNAQQRRHEHQEAWSDETRRRQFAARPREAARREQLAAALVAIRALSDDDLAIEHAALIVQRAELRADLQIQDVIAERRNQPWRCAVEKRLARLGAHISLIHRELAERARARKAARAKLTGDGSVGV
jgi:hypothetical protein